MATRTLEKQTEHDAVLAQIVKLRWSGGDGRVYSNPDGKQTCSVNYQENGTLQQAYPDIVVLEPNDNTVRCVGEVETAETVTQAESQQWTRYRRIGGTLYLYVPAGTEETARSLVGHVAGIKLRRWRYGLGAVLIVEDVN